VRRCHPALDQLTRFTIEGTPERRSCVHIHLDIRTLTYHWSFPNCGSTGQDDFLKATHDHI
jgi:hypothetical protein